MHYTHGRDSTQVLSGLDDVPGMSRKGRDWSVGWTKLRDDDAQCLPRAQLHRTGRAMVLPYMQPEKSPAPWKLQSMQRKKSQRHYVTASRWQIQAGPMDRRLGGESNREIVSCRACVRAQSVSLVRSRPQFAIPSPSLFPLCPRAFPFSLVGLNGIKWNQVTSNEINWNEIEIKRDQVKPHEIKWSQVKSNEINWNLIKWHEIEWNQLKSSDPTWNHVKPSETKWNQANQVKSNETKRNQMKSNKTTWNQMQMCETRWDHM